MSPLSHAERNLTRRRHIPELPRVPQCVRQSLLSGSDTAPEIHHQTGLPLEAVYEALVWLEARGKACVVVSKAERRAASWGAL
jgi:hypothetical protein